MGREWSGEEDIPTAMGDSISECTTSSNPLLAKGGRVRRERRRGKMRRERDIPTQPC